MAMHALSFRCFSGIRQGNILTIQETSPFHFSIKMFNTNRYIGKYISNVIFMNTNYVKDCAGQFCKHLYICPILLYIPVIYKVQV